MWRCHPALVGLIRSLWIVPPSCWGTSVPSLPLFVPLFRAKGKQSEKAAPTPCSTLDEFFLYSEKAVVFGHSFAPRKTPQLDKPGAESNSLKWGKQLILNRRVLVLSSPLTRQGTAAGRSWAGVLFIFVGVKWPAGKLSTEGPTDGVPDRPSGTFRVLRVRRFHRNTAWPFAPRLGREGGEIASVHPSHFTVPAIFPELQFCLF